MNFDPRDCRVDTVQTGIPLTCGDTQVRVTHLPTGVSASASKPNSDGPTYRLHEQLLREVRRQVEAMGDRL